MATLSFDALKKSYGDTLVLHRVDLDVNDGEYLIKTLEDLYQFHPILKSCTIVPVGLTGHRKGLMEIKSVNTQYAKNLLNEVPQMRNQSTMNPHDSLTTLLCH